VDEACYVEPASKTVAKELLRNADTALLEVSGMGCQNCVARVRNGLLELDGVYEVDIFLNMGLAEVRYNGQNLSTHMLIDAVSRAGNDGRHRYRAQLVAIT